MPFDAFDSQVSAMEVQVNAENPPGNEEIPSLEGCESMAKDFQSPISQEKARENERSPIESEKHQEAGLPEVGGTKEQLTGQKVPSGTSSTHPQGETTETRDSLGEKEIFGENTGEKGANENSTLEPDLKRPRLEASCGVSEVVIKINEETPNPQSTGIIESSTLKEDNPTNSRDTAASGKYQDHDFIIQLIAAVKEHRGLYDNNRSIFYDEYQDWTAIAEKLGSPMVYCKSKFASLREKFEITHGVMCHQTKESVTDLKNDFPSFPYYEDLLFLKDYTNNTRTWGNKLSSQNTTQKYKWTALNCSTPIPTWLESKEDPSKSVTTNIFREKLLELEKEASAKQLVQEVTETKTGDEEQKADSKTDTDIKTPTESGQSGDKIPVGGFFDLVNIALKTESQDYNTKLIKAVKEHPCIYDRNNEQFSDILFKTSVWDSIAQKLGKTREECLKTYDYLSQRFAQTHAMLQNHRLARHSSRNVRFPYYDDMFFLKDHVNLTEGQDFLDTIAKVFNKGNEVKDPGSSRPTRRRRGKNNQQNDQKGVSNREKYQWNRYQNDFNQIQPHFVHPGLPPPMRQPWTLMPQNKCVPEAVQSLNTEVSPENRPEADDKVIVIENSDDSDSVGAAFKAEFPSGKDLIVQLIQAVKGYPCIYDHTNEHFSNEGHLEAWTEISKKLQKRREECQAVYESLYKKFVQTYAMLHDPELVKQGFSKDSFEPFEHYDDMQFLENQINIEELQSHVKTIKETSPKAALFPLLQQHLGTVEKSPRVRFQNRSRPYPRNAEVKPQRPAPLVSTSENVSSSQTNQEKLVAPCTSGSSHPINVPVCQDKPSAMLDNRGSLNENFLEAPNHTHIDFFFKSFCEQVKRANLSDRDFVQMQITMMTALSNTLSQGRN